MVDGVSESETRKLDEVSEEGLVSTLLAMPDQLSNVIGMLSEDDFTNGRYRAVFRAMMGLNDDGRDISMPNVADWLNSHNELVRAPVSEVIRLYNAGMMSGTQATVEAYAHIIKDRSANRRLRKAIAEASDAVNGSKGLTKDIISSIQSNIDEILLGLSDSNNSVDVREYQDEYAQELLERRDKFRKTGDALSAAGGIPTGYEKIDEATGGLMPGQVFTVGGRTGVGKSFTAVKMAINAAQAGQVVMFFSLEMPVQEIMNRFISSMSRVSLSKLINGSFTDEELERVKKAQDEFRSMHIIIDATPNIDVDYIKGKAMKQMTSPDGLGLIILDYLQLLTPRASRKNDNRERQVADMSRNLKVLAMQLQIPIVSLVQLNKEKKEDEDPTPRVSDIRESYAIAQDSSVILLVHRNIAKDNTDDKAVFIIGKNRNGKSNLRFTYHARLDIAQFMEMDEDGDSFDPSTVDMGDNSIMDNTDLDALTADGMDDGTMSDDEVNKFIASNDYPDDSSDMGDNDPFADDDQSDYDDDYTGDDGYSSDAEPSGDQFADDIFNAPAGDDDYDDDFENF